eukprot:gene45887-62142_t
MSPFNASMAYAAPEDDAVDRSRGRRLSPSFGPAPGAAQATAIYDISVVPVFYHPDFETAKNAVAAISRGGCKLVEFVNRGDHAWQVFSELERHFMKADPSLILGVGSIVEPYTAAMYINCGANFVVGPSLNPEVAKLCNRRMIPYSPGCGSASEISDAQELGCEIVKVFPGKEVGGPGFVKN